MDFLLTKRNRDIQHLSFTSISKANGIQHCSIAHLAILAYLIVVSVQPEIRTASQWSLAPGFQLFIQ
jgi:hypothetical protein